MKPAPDWELVYKRNPVERIKRDRSPLGILDELPALIAAGYERVDEEDIVRLKWWGLYHDKPKVGTFMLRIKLPGGRVSPDAAARDRRDLERVRTRRRRALDAAERPAALARARRRCPTVFDRLHAAGLTSAGGCGDAVRNITGCPVAGLDADELFDTQPVVDEAAEFFYGNPDYSNLPRKHKITIAACAHHCNAPEINCIALVGAVHEGVEGFARPGGRRALVGAADRARPRRLRPQGGDGRGAARAARRVAGGHPLPDLPREGADEVHGRRLRAGRDARRGRAAARPQLADFALAAARHARATTSASMLRSSRGSSTSARRCTSAWSPAIRWSRVADLAERSAATSASRGSRTSSSQTSRRRRSTRPSPRSGRSGSRSRPTACAATAIGCTGEPHCNFSVTETKTRLDALVVHLEERFGEDIAGLRLHLDGCPHACAQHWVGDIGFQGTTVRDEPGKRRQAYDVFLRGGLGPQAAIARPVFRRVPTEELDVTVDRLVAGWLTARGGGRGLPRVLRPDERRRAGILAGREPARAGKGGARLARSTEGKGGSGLSASG